MSKTREIWHIAGGTYCATKEMADIFTAELNAVAAEFGLSLIFVREKATINPATPGNARCQVHEAAEKAVLRRKGLL